MMSKKTIKSITNKLLVGTFINHLVVSDCKNGTEYVDYSIDNNGNIKRVKKKYQNVLEISKELEKINNKISKKEANTLLITLCEHHLTYNNYLRDKYKQNYEGCTRIVNFLIKNGANVNIINNLKETPLMLAGKYAHLDIVKLLLKYGAKIGSKNTFNLDALDIVLNSYNDNIKSGISESEFNKNELERMLKIINLLKDIKIKNQYQKQKKLRRKTKKK